MTKAKAQGNGQRLDTWLHLFCPQRIERQMNCAAKDVSRNYFLLTSTHVISKKEKRVKAQFAGRIKNIGKMSFLCGQYIRHKCSHFPPPRFAHHLNLDLLLFPKPSWHSKHMLQQSACLCLAESRETLILIYGLYSMSTWGPISSEEHSYSETWPGGKAYRWAGCLHRSNFKLKLSSE